MNNYVYIVYSLSIVSKPCDVFNFLVENFDPYPNLWDFCLGFVDMGITVLSGFYDGWFMELMSRCFHGILVENSWVNSCRHLMGRWDNKKRGVLMGTSWRSRKPDIGRIDSDKL